MVSSLDKYKDHLLLENALLELNQEGVRLALLSRVDQRRTKDGEWFISMALKDAYGKPIYGQIWNIEEGSETLTMCQGLVNMPVLVSFVVTQFNKSNRLSLSIRTIKPVAWEDVKPLLANYFSSTYAKGPAMQQQILKFISSVADEDVKRFLESSVLAFRPEEMVDPTIMDGSIGGVLSCLGLELAYFRAFIASQADVSVQMLYRFMICAIFTECLISKHRPTAETEADTYFSDIYDELSEKCSKYPKTDLIYEGLTDAKLAISKIFGLNVMSNYVVEMFLTYREATHHSISVAHTLSCYPEGSVVNVKGKSIKK